MCDDLGYHSTRDSPSRPSRPALRTRAQHRALRRAPDALQCCVALPRRKTLVFYLPGGLRVGDRHGRGPVPVPRVRNARLPLSMLGLLHIILCSLRKYRPTAAWHRALERSSWALLPLIPSADRTAYFCRDFDAQWPTTTCVVGPIASRLVRTAALNNACHHKFDVSNRSRWTLADRPDRRPSSILEAASISTSISIDRVPLRRRASCCVSQPMSSSSNAA
jgi:hypothetical protein